MASTSNDTERSFLPGALLVAAVLAILGIGMYLATDPPRASRGLPAATPTPPQPIAEPLDEAAALPEPEPPSGLSGRVDEDLRRLGTTSGRYTAQIVVACKPETVERLIQAAAGARALYVLPAQVQGSACYRVCWGSYATSEEAARTPDLPAALRSTDRPRAIEIVSVLP